MSVGRKRVIPGGCLWGLIIYICKLEGPYLRWKDHTRPFPKAPLRWSLRSNKTEVVHTVAQSIWTGITKASAKKRYGKIVHVLLFLRNYQVTAVRGIQHSLYVLGFAYCHKPSDCLDIRQNHSNCDNTVRCILYSIWPSTLSTPHCNRTIYKVQFMKIPTRDRPWCVRNGLAN